MTVEITCVVNVQAPSKEALLIAIDKMRLIARREHLDDIDEIMHQADRYDNFLYIKGPCGEVRRYSTREDVPEESVECCCGKVPYQHFFIRYEP